MSGKIDVGWAAPPFGIDAIEQDQMRVVARANDIPKIREKTVRVMIANADTLQTRKDVLSRFVQGCRETLEWMYSDPAAPKAYAQFAGLSEAVAQRLRDEFFTKEMLSPDNIMGLNAIAKEAATLKYIWVPLSNKQLADSFRFRLRSAAKRPRKALADGCGCSRPDLHKSRHWSAPATTCAPIAR